MSIVFKEVMVYCVLQYNQVFLISLMCNIKTVLEFIRNSCVTNKTPVKNVFYLHSGKKKLNEPRECLFKGLQSKVLVEK